MITGVVSLYREALVRVTVRGPGGPEQEIEAVIDTGFDGSLTLPLAHIVSLGYELTIQAVEGGHVITQALP